MLWTMGGEGAKRASSCPGVLDDVGAIRDTCRVCGKCDDLIRDMMRGIAAPSINKQPDAPARAPV